MATNLSLSSDQSISIGTPTRDMSSKETTIYNDQFNKLVKTLTHDALIIAEKNFLIRATETEESEVKDYLLCKITSNGPYRKHLGSFLSNAFEGVNRHYGNDREDERMKALSNLDFSVYASHLTGIRNINADSSRRYIEIYAVASIKGRLPISPNKLSMKLHGKLEWAKSHTPSHLR
ncbi:uncharacterized protein L199_000043 [Kwoniella botswanensis]|uniref:uncharacterized protein n=1 Tax=Kwoniella botswanensis TaxID=1268659 RepID=UPI00315DAD56